jgi:hypothetical protein
MNSIVQLLVKRDYSVLFASVFARQLCLPVPAILFLLAAGALAGCVDEPHASAAFLPSVAPTSLRSSATLPEKPQSKAVHSASRSRQMSIDFDNLRHTRRRFCRSQWIQ